MNQQTADTALTLLAVMSVAQVALAITVAVAAWAFHPWAKRATARLMELATTAQQEQRARHEHRVRERTHWEHVAHHLEHERATTTQETQDAEAVAKAHQVVAHNMALLNVVSQAIDGHLEPSAALTEPAQEGFRLARDAMRAQLKRGLQESQPTP